MSDMNTDFSREERNCFNDDNESDNCYGRIVNWMMDKYNDSELENRMDREN